MSYAEAAKELEAEIKDLHFKIDNVIKERIYAVAAKVSGAPVGPLKDIFIAQCSSGYCRCRAIRNIAAGADGL
jgi:hypothetical protein